MINNKNGTKISPTEIEYFVRGYTSIFLYISYVKGSEDEVVISFKVRNDNIDNKYYSIVTGQPNNLSPFKYILNQTSNIVLQCPIPENTHYCLVSFEYVGGIQSTYGDINISVDVNTLKY